MFTKQSKSEQCGYNQPRVMLMWLKLFRCGCVSLTLEVLNWSRLYLACLTSKEEQGKLPFTALPWIKLDKIWKSNNILRQHQTQWDVPEEQQSSHSDKFMISRVWLRQIDKSHHSCSISSFGSVRSNSCCVDLRFHNQFKHRVTPKMDNLRNWAKVFKWVVLSHRPSPPIFLPLQQACVA